MSMNKKIRQILKQFEPCIYQVFETSDNYILLKVAPIRGTVEFHKVAFEEYLVTRDGKLISAEQIAPEEDIKEIREKIRKLRNIDEVKKYLRDKGYAFQIIKHYKHWFECDDYEYFGEDVAGPEEIYEIAISKRPDVGKEVWVWLEIVFGTYFSKATGDLLYTDTSVRVRFPCGVSCLSKKDSKIWEIDGDNYD